MHLCRIQVLECVLEECGLYIAKHLICTEFLPQDTIDKLHPLPLILNQITESLGPDAPRITVKRCDSLILVDTLATKIVMVLFLLKQSLSCSQVGQAKPDYVPPKDLRKYSPHQSSLQQLPVDPKGLRDRLVQLLSSRFPHFPLSMVSSLTGFAFKMFALINNATKVFLILSLLL